MVITIVDACPCNYAGKLQLCARMAAGRARDTVRLCLAQQRLTPKACAPSSLGNYYSNKRWCCGDMDHFDISVWAFERLASTKWGVIAL